MNRRADLAGSLVFTVVGLLIAVYAATRPTASLRFDAIGPMGLPGAVGAALAVLGLTQSVKTLRALRADGPVAPDEGNEDDEPDLPASPLRAAAFMVGSFVYIALLPVLGFLIVTPLFLLAALTAMRYRSWLGRVVVAVAFSTVGFVVFVVVLSVPVPQGLLSDALLRLGLIDYN